MIELADRMAESLFVIVIATAILFGIAGRALTPDDERGAHGFNPEVPPSTATTPFRWSSG